MSKKTMASDWTWAAMSAVLTAIIAGVLIFEFFWADNVQIGVVGSVFWLAVVSIALSLAAIYKSRGPLPKFVSLVSLFLGIGLLAWTDFIRQFI